jgi:hypothetical protein
MNFFLTALLLYVFPCEKVNEMQLQSGDIYLYESAPKMYGQGFIGFIITDSVSAIQRISYKIFFSGGHISKVDKAIHTETHPYTKKTDGSIYVEGIRLLAYSTGAFSNKRKMNPEELYKLPESDFLNKTNKEKMDVLDEFYR